MMQTSPTNPAFIGAPKVRDIYELIRQRENEIARFQKEVERMQIELEALRLSARLLDDGQPVRAAAPPVAPQVERVAPVIANRPATQPMPSGAWASAKQF